MTYIQLGKYYNYLHYQHNAHDYIEDILCYQ